MREKNTHYALRITLELSQKSQIVSVQQADVVNGVAEHGYALDAHAEGEAAVLFGVYPAVDQHLWVDHACPQDFQPAGVLARPAAHAAAYDTVNRQVNARLDIREVVAAEAGLALGAEDGAGEG